MSKQFEVWYEVVESYQVIFEADSLDEAERLVALVADDKEAPSWLAEANNGFEKVKGIETQILLDTLEEI
jgi:hypothetical protein